MNKKVMIGGITCLSLLLIGAWFMEEDDPVQQISNDPVVSEQVQEQASEKEDKQDIHDIEAECRKAAEQFVKAKNEGKSSDVFVDRIDPVKHLLSEELYHSVVPQLSKEQIEEMRKESERLTDSDITKTTLTSIESASRELDENDYEIYVLYTSNAQFSDSVNTSRYLVRMKVQWIDNKPKIYKIIEESMVADGLYQ